MKKLLSILKFCRVVFITSILTHWMYFVEANKEVKENLDELYAVYQKKNKGIFDDED